MSNICCICFIVFVVSVYCICLKLDSRLPTPLTSNEAGEDRFSEQRARRHLNAFAEMGARIAGSRANERLARDYILDQLGEIRTKMKESSENRLDVHVHKSSGCFGLDFLSKFSANCYKNVTNVVARLRGSSSDHSLMFNCHFDSVSQSPGASDDAVSCAIMLELLDVFTRRSNLSHDFVFLFNGGEENFLQASHGFVNNHPWRSSIRAVINLEACGAGGRERLFQSGSVWLTEAYLDSAPYPHCNILAQEIFQSGIIPGDTDYRIFRDFGRIPGMDFAYTKNGYVYHTEFDRPEFVTPGSIQHAGDNVLQTATTILRSPCFVDPQTCPSRNSRLVYFDVLGLFVIRYSATIGKLLNTAVLVLVIFRVIRENLRAAIPGDGGYSYQEMFKMLGIHSLTLVWMTLCTLMMILTTENLGLSQSWYSWRPMVLILYGLPPMIVGFVSHELWNLRLGLPAGDRFRREMITFDTAMLFFGVILAVMTLCGLGSAYYAMVLASPPVLRDTINWIIDLIAPDRVPSRSLHLLIHSIAIFPPLMLASYAMITVLEVFIPIMGRGGPLVDPEIVIGLLGLICAMGAVLYMGGMVHLFPEFTRILKSAVVLLVVFIGFASMTDFGAPYDYKPDAPRLRRFHVQHVTRTIYSLDGSLNSSDAALFFAPLDYRGYDDLPPELLEGAQRPPCLVEDAYCGLPFYIPVIEMFPPKKLRWKLVDSKPKFAIPIKLELTSRVVNKNGTITLSFSLTGSDHMTVFVTPLNGWTLDKWSMTEEILGLGKLKTFFVYLSYVGDGNGPWKISITLKKASSSQKGNEDHESKLLLGVASHYLHGAYRHTPETQAIQAKILERRGKPSTAFNRKNWKWAMTADTFASEYVARYF